ncbi:PREDICTED: pentatricopeptide repeat-containing protein At5g43790 [Nelumbo nucifera]|uniref:Pentatricopeptide repeat-containing protein At5g43790 n=2 Tax=Nelumbo nucifera TaxID=4432 RepID=A0A1U8BCS8_NELNU|nr:PREDICTED: pentatricopeptide repeat-containing protein At5g43790 [Nelumbo nucifera]DAD19667.1 TPA_asm: hypothetical protein HUJ06_021130 [Nelumbo nucifera]
MKSPKSTSNHPILLLLEECRTLKTLKQVHAQMITMGLILHTFPISRILLLSSILAPPYALSIFNQIQHPTVFLFNTLVSSLAAQDYTHVSFSLYSRILSDKTLRPNNFTYPSLFKACGSHPWLDHGRALHAHVVKFLEPTSDHFVRASLLNFYAKCGKLAHSRYLFNQISAPDLATWNSILACYARSSTANVVGTNAASEDTGLAVEVLSLFGEMQLSPIRPNEVTLVALIGACADLGALTQGTWAHAHVLKNNLSLNRFLCTALIDMYGKCGCLHLAKQVFDQLPQKDTLCYNAMIRGLAIHGHGQQALDLFNTMTYNGVRPDEVTIVVVISGCAHVGLVEEGRKLFLSMKEAYGIEPKLEHYGCLVDLLGRAGRLKEAEEIVRAMPMKPNAVLWRSLLGASRVHGNLELGEVALRNLIQLEPETSGNYVLLSNMYASINRWDDVRRVRKVMKDQGINKMPGCSLIEIGGEIHEFIMGDRAHPHSKEIYLKIEEISKRLNAYGHRPSTKEVLFDIEEEEKEDALSYHSERLAIAFALIFSTSSVPIRIIKNLRVCGDCHATTKLISKIYHREIIVRDRSRFHHFRDGACSCLDYW